MSDDRVTDLEIRMAFLEDTVRTLDQVIQDMGTALDATRRELKDLRDAQGAQAEAGKGSLSSTERMLQEKPPHY